MDQSCSCPACNIQVYVHLSKAFIRAEDIHQANMYSLFVSFSLFVCMGIFAIFIVLCVRALMQPPFELHTAAAFRV